MLRWRKSGLETKGRPHEIRERINVFAATIKAIRRPQGHTYKGFTNYTCGVSADILM